MSYDWNVNEFKEYLDSFDFYKKCIYKTLQIYRKNTIKVKLLDIKLLHKFKKYFDEKGFATGISHNEFFVSMENMGKEPSRFYSDGFVATSISSVYSISSISSIYTDINNISVCLTDTGIFTRKIKEATFLPHILRLNSDKKIFDKNVGKLILTYLGR